MKVDIVDSKRDNIPEVVHHSDLTAREARTYNKN
jgi:hypothetical protein